MCGREPDQRLLVVLTRDAETRLGRFVIRHKSQLRSTSIDDGKFSTTIGSSQGMILLTVTYRGESGYARLVGAGIADLRPHALSTSCHHTTRLPPVPTQVCTDR